MKRPLLVALALAGALTLAILGVVSGLFPVAASSGHWAITAWFLHFAMERSVATHARGIDVPALDDARLVRIGGSHYEGGCRMCHGAPGSRLPRTAQASTPHAPALVPAIGKYDEAELFYIVRHGIKFTGMPAWPAPQREDEVWSVVAFLRTLPELDRARYEQLVFGGTHDDEAAPELVRERCVRCHGADGRGPRDQAFPNLAAQRTEYLTHTLTAYAEGTRHSGIMEPIAAGLTDWEIRTAADWYASRPTAPAVASQDGEPGAELARDGDPGRRVPPCATCHGPQHEPQHPAYPRLAGQHASYLTQQLALFRASRRGGGPYHELMQKVAHWLDPEQARDVARYYASLAGDELAEDR